MNTKQTAKVGLFILIGLIFFAGGVLVIGNMRKIFVKQLYVNALFTDVNGLTKGNNVWFSGVKVGTVQELNFTKNNGVLVTFSIEEKSKDFIYKDAFAKISSDGLIGSPIIVIGEGTPASGVVETGHRFKVEREDSQQDMMKTLQENNKNILAITNDLKSIVGRIEEGEGSVGKLLKDEELYAGLKTSVGNLQAASVNISGMSSNLNGFSKKLTDPEALPNQLLTDRTIMPALKGSMNDLSVSTQNLKESSVVVKSSVNELSATVSKIGNEKESVLGVMLNDPEAAKYVKGTLNNLETGSETLNEDLEALQHNFLFRRYFKKKEQGKL